MKPETGEKSATAAVRMVPAWRKVITICWGGGARTYGTELTIGADPAACQRGLCVLIRPGGSGGLREDGKCIHLLVPGGFELFVNFLLFVLRSKFLS